MGIVVETGPGVSILKKGDRVVMPFNVADGRCRNCEEGKTASTLALILYSPAVLIAMFQCACTRVGKPNSFASHMQTSTV